VPELPDLAIVADALHAALAGRIVASAEAPGSLSVRGTPADIAGLEGRSVRGVTRRGKFLIMDLDPDRVVVNPMLTGRFQLSDPGRRRPAGTTFVLAFGARSGKAGARARWTRNAAWLMPDDQSVEVRYRDPTHMGKVYILPGDSGRTVPGLEDGELGPDADDPALTLDVWRERIRRHQGELKNLLRNQAFVAGIGNAYSDEILHAARLLPFRKRSTLAAEEVDELYAAVGATLSNAIRILQERVPPTFETQVRDFLAVHLRGGSACPRCGAHITEVKAGGSATSYCRGCQS